MIQPIKIRKEMRKMRENELEYYSKIANWDFSSIKCETDFLTDWNYFEEIKKHTNERSLCLDLGTIKVNTKITKKGKIIFTNLDT